MLLFLAASIALALAPGPDNLFVLTQSALLGKRAGVWVTLGLCSGLLVHTAAVTLGIAAVFQSSELAFNLLKAVGAAYLVYLAWQAWRAPAVAVDANASSALGPGRLYLRGVIMNVTNPKVAIFFLAFLPQFAEPSLGPLGPQIIVLGALFMVVTLIVFSAIALGAGLLGEWLRSSSSAQQILNRCAATVFLALALRLLLSER